MKPEYYKNEKNIDIIDFCKMYDLNFNRGNVLKYIARAGKKENELEDLKKAMEYLKREIEHIMTLKEKFETKNSIDTINEAKAFAKECEQIADEYAIEFIEWNDIKYKYLKGKGWFRTSFELEMGFFLSTKELLEIFKKEKGL